MKAGPVLAAAIVAAFSLGGCGDSDEGATPQPEAPVAAPPVDVAMVVAGLGSAAQVFEKVVKNPANGSVYALSAKSMQFKAAKQLAARVGGLLVDVDGREEQAFVNALIGSSWVWLGLERISPGGEFIWHSGAPVTFTDWRAGEPNDYKEFNPAGEPYGVMGFFEPGKWNDLCENPSYPAKALVEFKPGAASTLTDHTALALRGAVMSAGDSGAAPYSASQVVNALAVYRPERSRKSRLKGHALLVAVGGYRHLPPLSATIRDIECLAPILTAQGFSVTMMTDKTPEKPTSAEAISAKLQWLAAQASADDTLIFCFSGHGYGVKSGSRWLNFMCHSEISPSDNSAFSVEVARDILESPSCKAQKRVIVVDACRSRVTSGSPATGAPSADNTLRGGFRFDHLQASRGTGILFATTPGYESMEIRGGVDRDGQTIDNGIFTHFVVKGLRGRAEANADGFVTFHELTEYLSHRMKEFSTDNPECKQKPYVLWDGAMGDDIALVDLEGLDAEAEAEIDAATPAPEAVVYDSGIPERGPLADMASELQLLEVRAAYPGAAEFEKTLQLNWYGLCVTRPLSAAEKQRLRILRREENRKEREAWGEERVGSVESAIRSRMEIERARLQSQGHSFSEVERMLREDPRFSRLFR